MPAYDFEQDSLQAWKADIANGEFLCHKPKQQREAPIRSIEEILVDAAAARLQECEGEDIRYERFEP